jgi:putative lysine/arginine/ornithine/histidine/octopine transport system substrate-binding protein
MNGSFWRGAVLAPAMALVAGGLLAGSTNAHDIRIATEGTFAPFNYIDHSGNRAGFDVDISYALCKFLGATRDIVQKDWGVLIPGLNDDEYEEIIASMSITAERELLVDFFLPYYPNLRTFVGKKNRQLSTSLGEFDGNSVGVFRSTVSSDYVNAAYADVVSNELLVTQDDALAALIVDEIDLVLGDNLSIYDWLRTVVGQKHAFVCEFLDINDLIGIPIRKTDCDLPDRFNETPNEIIKNGKYQKINAKYFPVSFYF